MLEPITALPTSALRRASRRLELRILEGRAGDRDIDLFVAMECEIGRRIAVHEALPGSLDGVLDPRD